MDTFSRTFKDCHGPVATMLLVCFWKSCFVNIVLWSMETQQLDAGCSNFSCRQRTSHTITTTAIYYTHSYSLVPTEDTKTVQYATDINCTMLVMNMMPVSADVHLPSVLWHCRLGVKIECWCGYLSGVRCWLLAHDIQVHPQTPSPLALLKSRLVAPLWHWLIQVVLEKEAVKRVQCSSSSSS